MRLTLSLIGCTLFAGLVCGQQPTSIDQAKASLAIAKAARERGVKPVMTATGCFTDLAAAEQAAAEQGRPLILWVGMECSDAPVVRSVLAGAVHCHLPSYRDDAKPRVVFPHVDGGQYQYAKSQIDKCPECAAETIQRYAGLKK